MQLSEILQLLGDIITAIVGVIVTHHSIKSSKKDKSKKLSRKDRKLLIKEHEKKL